MTTGTNQKNLFSVGELLMARQRPQPAAQQSQAKFTKSTHPTGLNIYLGEREKRMLAYRLWAVPDNMRGHDFCTLQKLIDKGYIEFDDTGSPQLSWAGELMCQILIHTGEAPPPFSDAGANYRMLEFNERMQSGDQMLVSVEPNCWTPILESWYGKPIRYSYSVRRFVGNLE